MTLAAVTPLIEYLENGVGLTHAVPFQFQASTDLLVTRVSPLEVEATAVLGADYSVTGGAGAAGSVTMASAKAAGWVLRIRRRTARTQPANYANGGGLDAETLEAGLDRHMAAVQEIEVEQGAAIAAVESRALKVPLGETAPVVQPAASRAGKFALWSATGEDLLSSFGNEGDDAGLRADMADPSVGDQAVASRRAAGYSVLTLRERLALGIPLNLREVQSDLGDPDIDASAALLTALESLQTVSSHLNLYSEGRGALDIPEGVYRLTESGLLSAFSPLRLGYLIRGRGKGTVLWLDPAAAGGDDLWFYDNAAHDPETRAWGNEYHSLVLAGGDDWRHDPSDGAPGGVSANFNVRIKGFRFTGAPFESAHVFSNVLFRGIDDVVHCAGANHADTIRHLVCEYWGCRRIAFIDNPQAMCLNFVSPYVSLGLGTFLEFGANGLGGGNVLVNGGAIIQSAELSDDPADMGDAAQHSYAVRAVDGGPTTGNAPVTFNGVRFELRDNCRLMDVEQSTGALYQYSHCSFLATNETDKKMARIGGPGIQAQFYGCSLEELGAGDNRWEIDSALGHGVEAWLQFTECRLPGDFHENVVWAGSGGRLTVSCCTGDFPASDPNRTILDCDITKDPYSTHCNLAKPLRMVPLSFGFAPGTLTGFATTLPPYSRVRRVFARVQSGGVAGDYQLHITNGDKSTVYATSTTAAQSANNAADSGLISVNLGGQEIGEPVSSSRVVRLWADDGAGGAPPANSGAAAIEAWAEVW